MCTPGDHWKSVGQENRSSELTGFAKGRKSEAPLCSEYALLSTPLWRLHCSTSFHTKDWMEEEPRGLLEVLLEAMFNTDWGGLQTLNQELCRNSLARMSTQKDLKTMHLLMVEGVFCIEWFERPQTFILCTSSTIILQQYSIFFHTILLQIVQ